LYRNKVCLVFGLFLFIYFFCANAFWCQIHQPLNFSPKKKVIWPSLWRSQWIYQKFWVNRFFTIVTAHGLFHIPKLWKPVLGGSLFFSFLLSNNTQGTQGEEYVQFLMNKHAKTIRLQCKICHK
jgi:hypothetical protein